MRPYLKPIFTLLLPACLFLSVSHPARAQVDSAAIKQRIFVFADSLVRSYFEKDWNTYIKLTHAGIVRLYGSMDTYVGIQQKVRARFEDVLEEKKEEVTVKQFVFTGNNWQCIVQRVHDTHLGGKSAKITTYMVGQSKDDTGNDWKFFDVADNLLVNISSIMPDFSDELVVPEKKIAYDGVETSAVTTAERTAAKPKKKAPGKK